MASAAPLAAQQPEQRRRDRPGEQGEEQREAQAQHQRVQHQGAGILDPLAAQRARHGRGHAAAHAAGRHHLHQHHEREHQREARQRVGAQPAEEKVSAIATKVWTIMTAVVGPASRHRLRPIGAVSRGWDTDASRNLGAYAQSIRARVLSPDKRAAIAH